MERIAEMSQTQQQGNKDNGFIPLRRGLFEHIRMGLMKGRDIPTYVALHFFADYKTGVAYNVSAPFLAEFLHEKPERVRRSLRRLEKGGYIKRFRQKGGDPGYPIVIDKFLVQKCISIDAAKSKSINEIAFTVKEKCILTVNREHIECTSDAHRVLPIKDMRSIEVKKYRSRGKKTTPPNSFTPPMPEQVKKYAETIGFPQIDAEYFCKYYAANEWKLKGGKPMTSWKQAVVTWKKREGTSNGSSQTGRVFAQTSAVGETIHA